MTMTKSTRPLSNNERLELYQQTKNTIPESDMPSGWEVFSDICTVIFWVLFFTLGLCILALLYASRSEPETRTFNVPMENSEYVRTQDEWEIDQTP